LSYALMGGAISLLILWLASAVGSKAGFSRPVTICAFYKVSVTIHACTCFLRAVAKLEGCLHA